jgi:hypothetical protein
MGEYQKSLDDIESAKEIQIGNSYENDILKLRSRVLAAVRLDQAALRKDPRPELFMSRHQTLRLNFGDAIPPCLVRGRDYHIRLNVTNEFGLWQREVGAAAGDATVAAPQSSVSVCCEVHRTWGSTSQVKIETSGGALGVDGRVSPSCYCHHLVYELC